jgi:DNA-binding PadR family transcriptional regulator
MTHRISEKAKEVATLKVLKYLQMEVGANASDIDRFANVRHLRNPTVLLAEMTQAGLIQRQQVPERRDGKSKPYHITDAGKLYLAEAARKAPSPGTKQRQDSSPCYSAPDLQRMIADTIRTLPEFRDSSDSRIQEVSQQLTRTISRSVDKGDSPSPSR